MSLNAKALAPGTLVSLCDTNGNEIGTAMFNPQSLICARILSREVSSTIDTRKRRSPEEYMLVSGSSVRKEVKI